MIAEAPLPSREAVQASMDDEFGDLALVYRIADEWIAGRLVEAIGIKCRAIRSEPIEGGYGISLLAERPLDSLTMHGDLLLFPVDAALGEA